MMNWILLVMATVAAVVVAMLLGGAMAPRTRVSVRSLRAARPATEVYARLREADGPPRWCAELPTMRVLEEQAPHRLTFTLLDDDGAEIGRWHITVAADGDDATGPSQVTITESVTVNNLILRFLRSLGGNGARPQRFLEAVAHQLDVAADVRSG
jgi:hypothetical protein